jgi:hypothetical protein
MVKTKPLMQTVSKIWRHVFKNYELNAPQMTNDLLLSYARGWYNYYCVNFSFSSLNQPASLTTATHTTATATSIITIRGSFRIFHKGGKIGLSEYFGGRLQAPKGQEASKIWLSRLCSIWRRFHPYTS